MNPLDPNAPKLPGAFYVLTDGEKNWAPLEEGTPISEKPRLTKNYDYSKPKTANVVEQMRRCPAYLPPNKWPQAMVLWAMSDEGQLLNIGVVPIEFFESLTESELFEPFNPKATIVMYSPTPELPGDQEGCNDLARDWMVNNDDAAKERIFKFLMENGWWIKRPAPRNCPFPSPN